jgi:hypothetical protein
MFFVQKSEIEVLRGLCGEKPHLPGVNFLPFIATALQYLPGFYIMSVFSVSLVRTLATGFRACWDNLG